MNDSRPTPGPGPAGRQLAAAEPTEASHKCFTCGKAIADGGWFCRIPHGAARIVLCSPWCAQSHFNGKNTL